VPLLTKVETIGAGASGIIAIQNPYGGERYWCSQFNGEDFVAASSLRAWALLTGTQLSFMDWLPWNGVNNEQF